MHALRGLCALARLSCSRRGEPQSEFPLVRRANLPAKRGPTRRRRERELFYLGADICYSVRVKLRTLTSLGHLVCGQ